MIERSKKDDLDSNSVDRRRLNEKPRETPEIIAGVLTQCDFGRFCGPEPPERGTKYKTSCQVREELRGIEKTPKKKPHWIPLKQYRWGENIKVEQAE